MRNKIEEERMQENKKVIQIKEDENKAEETNTSPETFGDNLSFETENEDEINIGTENEAEAIDTVKALEARVGELEKEVDANYERFVRVTADFDNYKKRTIREMNDLRKYANEKMLKDMLSVVDNIQRAVDSGLKDESDKSKLLEGVQITLKDVLGMLEKNGVKPFDSEGKPFDPAFHQAMMQEETEKYPDNTVLSELQKGYTIHDRLLRPAMVVVGRNPSSDTVSENSDKTNPNNGN